MFRDFSDESKKKLLGYVSEVEDEKICDFTDWLGDGWYSFEGWIGTLDIKLYINNVNAYHKKVIDKNNTSKSAINGIFESVDKIDKKYGSSLLSINDLLRKHNSCIIQMIQTITSGGDFTAAVVKSQMGSIFNGTEDVEKMLSVTKTQNFVQSSSENYFSSYSMVMSMYVNDIGLGDTVKTIVFNMFDLSKEKLIYGGYYEEMIAKERLMALLNDAASTYSYSESREAELISGAKQYLEGVKELGDGTYKYLNTHRYKTNELGEKGKLLLDGRTKEAKAFKGFLDELDNAADILKYGSQGIEFLTKLFADYQQSLEFLDAFERNYESDPIMSKQLKDIRALYERELNAWAREAVKDAYENGFDILLSKAGKACPVIGIVNTIGAGIDVIGVVTGEGKKTKATLEAAESIDMYSSIHSAYVNSYEKVKNAVPGSEGYDILIKDFEYCFELEKQTLANMCEQMAASSSGQKKEYYLYCKTQAEIASMDITHSEGVLVLFELMSYEEFINL